MDKFYCETQLSEHISKTPEGFLVCHDVPIMFAGEMSYGSDKVAKNIEQIHADETIRSFEGKPITLGHPTDEGGNNIFVTPENARNFTHGALQNVRPGSGKNANYLLGDFFITDKSAIDKVESGELRQVSCAYNYDAANKQDGFFEQTNIRGNHVALVPRGRAGPQCAIFDSKEEVKKMSFTEKLKEAISILTKAVDEESKPAESNKKKMAADESPMAEAMKDMAAINLDSRLSNLEYMFSELTEKLKNMVFDKVTARAEESAADSAEEPEEKPTEEIKESPKEEPAPEPEIKEEEGKKSAADAAESYDADTISKAEILSPGIIKTGKGLKSRALDSCYKTGDGKRIIDSILSGKSFDSADKDILFNATASLLSSHRYNEMKKVSSFDAANSQKEDYRSISTINRRNKEYWSQQKTGAM